MAVAGQLRAPDTADEAAAPVLGRLVPSLNDRLRGDTLRVGTVSLPIALELLRT